MAVEHGLTRRQGDLKPHPKNSRTHSPEQVAQIAASMGEWDWTTPILVDEDLVILAGHGRRMAGLAKFGGDIQVPVSMATGWSDEKKRAYVIADNRIAELAGWDEELLQSEIEALDATGFDLDLTGFSLSDFPNQDAGKVDPDEVPDLPPTPVTLLGDVWVLGNHRIICGDSTDAATVDRVLAGAKPHLMVTDPPYGVEYDANWRNKAARTSRGMGNRALGAGAVGKVLNDDRADWRDAWALFSGDVAYIWHADRHASAVQNSIEAVGFVVRCQIIWAKQQFAIGRGDYHWMHEPCWYAVRDGKTGHWAGDRKQTTVWQIAKPHKSETGHSTQKPIECMRRPIENNSKRGDGVYEPFSGSGTTIIAAEITGRRCYAVELSPAYVDVAVKRWEAYTGRAATDEAGNTFLKIASERS